MRLSGRSAVLFVAPAVLLYAAFLVYPTLRGLALSLTDARGAAGGGFVGAANYRAALADPAVLAALRNTVLYTVIVVVAQNALALPLAYWLHAVPAVRGLVRVGLLVPAATATVVVGYVWSYVYSPIGGPLHTVLQAFGLGRLERVWLGDPATALPAIAVTDIWMYLGYSTAIYLANYLAIPREILEAGAVDGAGGWARFRRLDWPLLAPSLTVNVTLATIGSLRMFDLAFVMTGGGPANATATLSLVVYGYAFREYRYGYATAVATLLLAATVVVSLFQVTALRRREARL